MFLSLERQKRAKARRKRPTTRPTTSPQPDDGGDGGVDDGAMAGIGDGGEAPNRAMASTSVFSEENPLHLRRAGAAADDNHSTEQEPNPRKSSAEAEVSRTKHPYLGDYEAHL